MCVFPQAEPQSTTNSNQHAGYAYEARLNGVTYKAHVYGAWRNQQSVDDADIEGVALGDAIAIGDAPTPTAQVATGGTVTAYTPNTSGPNTLLYIIAQFSDQTSDPIDETTAKSQMTVLSNFWMNCSSGVVYLKGIANAAQPCDFVHIRLPSTASSYVNNFSLLLSDAQTAASAQGYTAGNYNLYAVVTSNSGFSYAGLSYVGSAGSHWVAGYTSLRTAGHELGHNLGLYHANYWRTDSTQPFGKDSNPGGYVADTTEGEWVEYGHYFSVMSAQYGGEWDDATKPIYNPAEKVRLGWLSGSQVQYLTASGTNRLFRHDARSTTGTPRAIRIETPATDYTGYGHRYWLQYRYAPWNTAANWYQHGLEIDVAETSYGADGSIQLDMTPYSNDQASPFFDANSPPGGWWTIDNNDKMDGALLVGRTYDDNTAGIHVTPIATGSNGTGEEYIDVVVNLGSFAGNHPPLVSSLTASTNQVTTGQAVNFAVTATDPDGDTLAYSWDFGDPQVWTASGLNSSTAAKSWSTPGQYRVVARVSDMKGGVTTASQIITVGAPSNTGQVWGRVLWGGQPVYGARIWTNTWAGTTAAQAWTESDGSYVLPSLPGSGPWTINCQAAGLTFTAQFTNPVSLSSGKAYAIDFYANQPLSGAGGGYTVSGQVTDPVNGAAGIEVRGGGMVTTTDASGNYQLTNLLNGSYTVTPRYAGWTFSPSSRSVSVNSANSTGNNFSRAATYSLSGSFSGVPTGHGSSAPMVYLSNGRSVAATGGTSTKGTWSYTLNNVPAGQYSVTAFLYGYNLSPSGFSNPLTISGNASGLNFSGTASANIAGAIAGRITQYSVPLPGVTVSALQGGSTIGSALTDSDGCYRIDDLPSGAYTVSASKSGYSFAPGSISVGSIPSSGNNFAASGSVSAPLISGVTANPSVVASTSATTLLSASASGVGPISYSWDALTAAGPVTFSPNDSAAAASTTVSFQAAGSYTFRVRVTDTNGFATTATTSVTVSAGAGSLAVVPYEIQVPSGQAINFQVDGWDQLGNRITATPTWSANSGGSIDSAGVFTASTPGGPFPVVATSAGISATGFVWVTGSQVTVSPSITTQPLDQSVSVNSNATFVVVAAGSAPLSYQWFLNGGSISGATASSYTRFAVQPGDAGNYSVQVTNSAGSALSSNAYLTVVVPPSITSQPLAQALPVSSNATFNVSVSGSAPFAYQWFLNGGLISGATASSYTRFNIQTEDAGNYSVRVANSAGNILSSNALLSVIVAPSITVQPLSQFVAAGSNVTLSVSASGSQPFSYQWQFEGSNVLSATTSTLVVSNAQSADAGNYSVIIANSAGSVTSSNALLTINQPPVLDAIADQIVYVGNTLLITNAATDLDSPTQSLTFGLEAGFPAGAGIDPVSGVFAWTPTITSAGTSNLIVVRVTDNGTPPLSDAKGFVVTVVSPPTIQAMPSPSADGTFTISWVTIPGVAYRIQYVDTLAATNWTALGPDIIATNTTITVADPSQQTRRFYRIVLP